MGGASGRLQVARSDGFLDLLVGLRDGRGQTGKHRPEFLVPERIA